MDDLDAPSDYSSSRGDNQFTDNDQNDNIFHQRKRREFIPSDKKDNHYWDRRKRNNEAAKRSREKRRINDMFLEQKILELSKENHVLKAKLTAIRDKFGVEEDPAMNEDQGSIANNQQYSSLNNEENLSVENHIPLENPVSDTLFLSPNVSPRQYNSPMTSYPSETTYNNELKYNSESNDEHCILYQHEDVNHHRGMQPNSYNEDDHEDIINYESTNQQENLDNHNLDNYDHTALNLSSSSSKPTEKSCKLSYSDWSSSPIDNYYPVTSDSTASLPHKLRHKGRFGERDAVQSLLALHAIKPEPSENIRMEYDNCEGFSDDRESRKFPSSTTSNVTSTVPSITDSFNIQEDETDDENLMCKVDRLTSELSNIKYLLVRRRIHKSDTDSDGSR